jgi:hypothetical protein
MTATNSPDYKEDANAVSVGSTDLYGAWVSVKDKLPPYLTPVVLADENRIMSFDPFGCWKGVGVLNGETMWRPYWDVIGERCGLTLDAVTHWMALPNTPNVQDE